MSRVTQRVGRELRERLAEILTTRVSDPRLAGVVIVEVRPSPDLSFARVFFQVTGDPAEAERALAKAKPFIRRCLGEESRWRRVPELDMRLDRTLDSADRLERVLRDLAAEREARSDASLEDSVSESVEDPLAETGAGALGGDEAEEKR